MSDVRLRHELLVAKGHNRINANGTPRGYIAGGLPPFRQEYANGGPVRVWLNLGSKEEVDELYRRWQQAGARLVVAPEDRPCRLRAFRVADLDGNQLRVFYDFSRELPQRA